MIDQKEQINNDQVQNDIENIVSSELQKKDEEKENLNKDDDEEEEIKLGKKRAQRKLEEKEKREETKKKTLKKIKNYYDKSSNGENISSLIYILIQQLNRENNDMLWLRILGLCDQFIQGQIPFNVYSDRAEKIQKEIARLSKYSYTNSHLTLTNENNPNETFNLKSDREKIGSLNAKTDLNLFLFKDWSIFNSLKYSDDIIPKIKIWEKKNEMELKKIIAKLGIPLKEAQQKFEYMKTGFRENLFEKFAYLIEYNYIDNIFVLNFTKQFDNKNNFGALDIARMANALLTCPYDFSGIFIFFDDFTENNFISFLI